MFFLSVIYVIFLLTVNTKPTFKLLSLGMDRPHMIFTED